MRLFCPSDLEARMHFERRQLSEQSDRATQLIRRHRHVGIAQSRSFGLEHHFLFHGRNKASMKRSVLTGLASKDAEFGVRASTPTLGPIPRRRRRASFTGSRSADGQLVQLLMFQLQRSLQQEERNHELQSRLAQADIRRIFTG